MYPGKGNKGVVLVYKKRKNNYNKPAKMFTYVHVNLTKKDPHKVYQLEDTG